MDATLSENDRTAIMEALRKGNKIEAIKVYRAATDCSLLDAKNFIDALVNKLKMEQPGMVPDPSGCGALMVMFGVGGILVAWATKVVVS